MRLLRQGSLARLLRSKGADSFVKSILVFVAITSEDGLTHLDEFLLSKIGNISFRLHEESFDVLNLELALMTVEVLSENSVKFTLLVGDGAV